MNKINTILLFLGLILTFACNDEDEVIPEVKLLVETAEPTAYGATDGSIDLTIQGLENIPYEIFWNTGDTSEDISGLVAGTYQVKVIFLDKAVANKTVVLEEPAPEPLQLDFTVSPPAKWGYSDATVQLDISNGIEPYSVAWSNGSTDQNLKGVEAGTYTVTVADSNPHGSVITQGIVVIGQPEFRCGTDSLIDVDGFRYPTVRLGDQCWTTVNLKTIHKPGWDPDDVTLDEAGFLIDGRYCDGLKCNTDMGAHYTWDAAMNGEPSGGQVQGIAPEGWHIPSRAEWQVLNAWLRTDGNGGEGTNVPNKIRGEDSPSGFDVLYAGNWGYGVFTGELGAFWTSTEYFTPAGDPTGEAYYRLVNRLPLFAEGHDIKEKGLSIRLVLNE